MSFEPTLPAVSDEVRGPVKLPQRLHDFFEHGREQEQVDEIRIELRSAPVENDLGGGGRVTSGPVASRVRDRIIRVGDADDARAERNLRSGKSARVPTPIPAFMMTQDAFAKIRIEARERREHFGASLRMGRNELPLARREGAAIADDVVQRRMNLADVVKEGDTLDASAFVLIEVRRAGEDQRIGGHAPYMRSGLVVVRVNGIEQGFEGRGCEALSGTPGCQLTRSEDAADGTHGDAGDGAKDTLFLRHCDPAKQEVGDMTRGRGRPAANV